MATIIAATAASGVQPREVHASVNHLYCEYTLTATMSAGDVVHVGKLPDRARIIDWALFTTLTLGAGTTISFGTQDNLVRFVSSATCSAILQLSPRSTLFADRTSQGVLIDISDAAARRYTPVTFQFNANATLTGAVRAVITYAIEPD